MEVSGKTETRKRRVAPAAIQVLQKKVHKERRFPVMEVAIGGGVVILLLAIYLFNSLPKSDIKIWPKVETLSFQEKITASKKVTAVDISKKMIPALYIEEVKEVTQSFPASGSASNNGKATGIIKIYNKISPSSPLSLKVGTHFLSDGEKYFVTLDKVTIPAISGKTAGSISVRVQAKEPGTSYNIGASKFSVPKLSGTAYFYSIWAESTEVMTGGYTGDVKKVTNADIANAKDVLTKKLLADAESALRARISEEYVLMDSALLKNVISATADKTANAIADNFNATAKVKVSALVFKKSDVAAFIKSDLAAQLPDGKNYLEKSLNIEYSADVVDMAGGTESLVIKVSYGMYVDIQKNDVVEFASRASASQIQQMISQKYGDGVYRTEVSFWPFWVKKAPSNKNRILVELNF